MSAIRPDIASEARSGSLQAATREPQERRQAAALQSASGASPKSKIQNLKSLNTINLLPYQRRWVEDDSKLKIAVKARQIGYSFAATLRAVFKCLARKTTWIFLSKGERQSRLLMEKVQNHVQTFGIVARTSESIFFEGTSLKQLEVRFANGSVIYGLPANPDTARGYTGHVTLDEFAFHADADKIYAALFPTITRGYGIEVISTPNGTQGKFYELAKAAGLVGEVTGYRGQGTESRPVTCNLSPVTWSPHFCDVYDAVRQGLQIDVALLRSGCEDESSWQQEFCCQFVSTVENFFSPELLAACLSAEASTDMNPSRLLASARGSGNAGVRFQVSGVREETKGQGLDTRHPAPDTCPYPDTRHPAPDTSFFLGIDIGRRHDRTVFWIDEVTSSNPSPLPRGEGGPPEADRVRASITRLVRTMENTPFDEQLRYARELLRLEDAYGAPLIRRACIDATGIGAHMAETLAREFGPRVEPVVFTAAVKEDLAFRTRRRMESRATLLPDTREIRRAFSAVKKFVTPSGNLRFDAARTEAGHADEFWAKALADLAADPDAHQRAAGATDGYMADAEPLVMPAAFGQIDSHWSAFAW